MYRLIRFFLFLLSAETSHNVSLKALSFLHRIGLLRPLFGAKSIESKPMNVMGIDFPNGVGLAAGLDKNGDHIDALASLGFGFIEIGTVTPRPQAGNPLPRLFRLPESEAIINRMGFNNKGVDYLIENVKKAKFDGVLGINIGKNFDTKVENATSDYLICLNKAYPHASYITVNISSPNTPGLRTLQYGEELRELLQALKTEQTKLAEQYKRYVPITIKVAPDLEPNEIESMSAVFLEQKIDALIATNTTLARDAVAGQTYADEQGGLSGKPVTQKSTDVIRQFHQYLGDAVPVIGIGGISSTEDAEDKLQAGSSLVQIYTGFIYQGPALIRKCLKAFSETKR